MLQYFNNMQGGVNIAFVLIGCRDKDCNDKAALSFQTVLYTVHFPLVIATVSH